MSAGGVSAGLFDCDLEATRFSETQWTLGAGDRGAATLSIAAVEAEFKRVIRQLDIDSIDVICVGSFMHSLILVDGADQPFTPVFTWLDQQGETGVELVRSRMNGRFHERTGCRYHAMFPV